MIVRLWLVGFMLLLGSACDAERPSAQIPGGYKIWVMNSQEIYLADSQDELLIGPALRTLGIADRHLVAFCEAPASGHLVNLKTVAYSVLELKSGAISTGLSKAEASVLLERKGDRFPEMLKFSAYPLHPN